MSINLIVITGSSGTGKSSLARALQEELLPDVWLHFSPDSIFDCLPPSIIESVNCRNDWSSVDSKALVHSAYACTKTLLKAGHRLIFDCVIANSKGAQTLHTVFGEFTPIFVGLTCSWDQIAQRTLARGDRTLEEAEHGFRSAGPHLWNDYTYETSTMSPPAIAGQLAKSLGVRFNGGGA